MRIIKTDMHIHTCLSHCAEISASPKRIVERSYQKVLSMIFITDHNSLENAEAAIKCSKNFEELMVYPGMEITSREEVHTLALFENLEDAYNSQKYIYNYLPDADNEQEYKEQIIANESDEVEGFLKKSLFNAVDISIGEVVSLIHDNNGLAIAAHIDRESFSVIGQLGFIPEDLKYDALEVSHNTSLNKAKNVYNEYASSYKFVTGSDSHSIESIGSNYTEFKGENNSFTSFASFLKNNMKT
jgi:predicted metal-dependent phosphoesterase TrpH